MNLKKVRGRPKSLQPVRDLTQAEIDEKVDRIKDVFKVGMALLPTPAEAEALLVSLALIREAGIQKDAGEEIGVSPRMMNYKVDIYDLRPLTKAIQAGRVTLTSKLATAAIKPSEAPVSASAEEVIHGPGFAAASAK